MYPGLDFSLNPDEYVNFTDKTFCSEGRKMDSFKKNTPPRCIIESRVDHRRAAGVDFFFFLFSLFYLYRQLDINYDSTSFSPTSHSSSKTSSILPSPHITDISHLHLPTHHRSHFNPAQPFLDFPQIMAWRSSTNLHSSFRCDM